MNLAGQGVVLKVRKRMDEVRLGSPINYSDSHGIVFREDGR